MEREPMQEGSWVIDKTYNELGTVSRLFSGSLTGQFGGRTAALLTKERIEMAPLDLQEEDLKDMMELALMTKDFGWARKIAQQMKEGVQG